MTAKIDSGAARVPHRRALGEEPFGFPTAPPGLQRSRRVQSNQQGVHPLLARVVQRHLQHAYRKEPAAHTQEAFRRFLQHIEGYQRPMVLDSGCGRGDSTVFLAHRMRDHLIVGIDKSLSRLRKNPLFTGGIHGNVLLLRADYYDFWRLCARHNIRFALHTIFYPNPWPKKRHLKRRIHGHPAFIDLLNISRRLEVRSNWQIYLLEFAEAVRLATGKQAEIERLPLLEPISAFERKYLLSGHDLYRLTVDLEP